MKNRTRIWQALTDLDLDPFSRVLANACLLGWLIETVI